MAPCGGDQWRQLLSRWVRGMPRGSGPDRRVTTPAAAYRVRWILAMARRGKREAARCGRLLATKTARG